MLLPWIGQRVHRSEEPPDMISAILQLEARMIKDGPIIKNGIVWHVFSHNANSPDDALSLIVHSVESSARLILAPGDYLVHAAFGRIGLTKHIILKAGQMLSETIILNAGGIKLNAGLPDGPINKNRLTFSIYCGTAESNEQVLIMQNIKSGKIVRLTAGIYNIVSNYGIDNAVVRSDIQVEAGKLLEAVMQHHAAQITLKLVRQNGGEALADTHWAIINDSGDIVREIANAYASLILVEGDYVAVAKNKDQIYQKEFSVSSGRDEEIEILTVPKNIAYK
ncbi:MAG: hypothetical protein JSC085_000844 [Candidatus Tokpelaia sp. JSC085]|nr:MAG: hypothetical protein JSC085_000844 [Candidatus Tokpelaia sp. JSC085]